MARAPLAEGSTGEAVTELQAHLSSLGHSPDGDVAGTFGPSTRAAVEAFQRLRGLRIDGIVGTLTWERLVEASHRLGDRDLRVLSPTQRGDDVAELQERLASLGFDPGRVDGIYGQNTAGAVAGFQRDAGIVADGVAGDATVDELRRLSGARGGALVTEVKERSMVRRGHGPLEELVVAIAHAGGPADLAAELAAVLAGRGAVAHLLGQRDDPALIAATNASGATCLVVLRDDRGPTSATALYFASERSESPAARRLAEALAQRVGRALGVTGTTRGMTLPVLRETSIPATVVELGPPDALASRLGALASALAVAIEWWGGPENE